MHRVGRQDGVVVVGGGKSAQECVPNSHASIARAASLMPSVYSVSSNLARRGIRVSMVFVASDAVMATPIPYPAFVRKSRYVTCLL